MRTQKQLTALRSGFPQSANKEPTGKFFNVTGRSKTEGSRRWEPEEGPTSLCVHTNTHTQNTIEEKEIAKRSETDRK